MFRTAFPRVQREIVKCQFCRAQVGVVSGVPLRSQLARAGWKQLDGRPVCSAVDCQRNYSIRMARELAERMGERDDDE